MCVINDINDMKNYRVSDGPFPDVWPPGTRFGFCPHCGLETTLLRKMDGEGGGSATHNEPACAQWMANPLAMILMPDEYLIPTRGRATR